MVEDQLQILPPPQHGQRAYHTTTNHTTTHTIQTAPGTSHPVGSILYLNQLEHGAVIARRGTCRSRWEPLWEIIYKGIDGAQHQGGLRSLTRDCRTPGRVSPKRRPTSNCSQRTRGRPPTPLAPCTSASSCCRRALGRDVLEERRVGGGRGSWTNPSPPMASVLKGQRKIS